VLAQVGLVPDSIAQALNEGGLLIGAIGVVSAGVCALGVITLGIKPEILRPAAALFVAADVLLQLPHLALPSGAPPQLALELHPYPMRTGLSAAMGIFAVRGLLDAPRLDRFFDTWAKQTIFLSAALCLRFTSVRLLAPGSVSANLLFALACSCCAYAVTPSGLHDKARELMAFLAKLVLRGLFSGYALVQRTWALLRAAVWAIVAHPVMVHVTNYLLSPVWKVVTPCMLPLATFAVAASCSKGVVGLVPSVCVCLCACASVCVRVCVCMCVIWAQCVCVCVCVCACMCVCVMGAKSLVLGVCV